MDLNNIAEMQNTAQSSPITSSPIETKEDLGKLRPLPQDIQEMGESDTACQYCGISYLLLHKYEKMEAHVKTMEKEFLDLKKYVAERPGMVSRLESLLKLQKQSALQVGNLEAELGGLKKQLEWDRADLSLFRQKNHELTLALVGLILPLFTVFSL